MFHVETKGKNFSNKELKDNQSIYSGSGVDIIYNKELGLAKTVFRKNKRLKENFSSSEYLPHSKRKFTLVSLLYSFVRVLMLAYKHKMIQKIISKKSKIFFKEDASWPLLVGGMLIVVSMGLIGRGSKGLPAVDSE